jgi:hypothetical protein
VLDYRVLAAPTRCQIVGGARGTTARTCISDATCEAGHGLAIGDTVDKLAQNTGNRRRRDCGLNVLDVNWLA